MALTLHLPLNDNNASTLVNALVGTDAALVGGNNTQDLAVAGPGGLATGALHLDGSADAIDISANSISIGSGNAWSLGTFVKFDTVGVNHGLFGFAGNNSGRIQMINGNQIRTFSAGTLFTFPAFNADQWYHILITHTAADLIRAFVDGTESGTGGLTDSSALTIDRIGLQNALYLDGQVSWVKLFNTDESANAAALAAEGTGGGATARQTLTLLGCGS